uniref:Ig-like domain-containing protein n=1 Tax=Periophthalmus magnuspinnatus TaxID=409849 RepID=A0A3B4BA95_9GOBI
MHLSPPTSLTLSMDSEVTEGQRVSIMCHVNSHPVSTLTLNRTSQGSSVELLRDTEHNSLTYSVTVSSAHSGEYTCSAHNTVGSDSTKRSLTVKCGSRWSFLNIVVLSTILSSLQSIFFPLSEAQTQRQQSEQIGPDFPFHTHFLQIHNFMFPC